MFLPIDVKSGVPIYIQLKEEIRLLIIKGTYPPGTQLPTVRQLAVELKINSNTVARAYAELEREGIISTQQGRGTFVCGLTPPREKDEREKQLELLLGRFLNEAYALGFTIEEVMERLAKNFLF